MPLYNTIYPNFTLFAPHLTQFDPIHPSFHTVQPSFHRSLFITLCIFPLSTHLPQFTPYSVKVESPAFPASYNRIKQPITISELDSAQSFAESILHQGAPLARGAGQGFVLADRSGVREQIDRPSVQKKAPAWSSMFQGSIRTII